MDSIFEKEGQVNSLCYDAAFPQLEIESMLDERHLQHQMTDEQRNSLNEDGHFTVENALPLDLVERLETRVDNIYQNHLDAGYDPYTKIR